MWRQRRGVAENVAAAWRRRLSLAACGSVKTIVWKKRRQRRRQRQLNAYLAKTGSVWRRENTYQRSATANAHQHESVRCVGVCREAYGVSAA
jgi:hypothetical protein